MIAATGAIASQRNPVDEIAASYFVRGGITDPDKQEAYINYLNGLRDNNLLHKFYIIRPYDDTSLTAAAQNLISSDYEAILNSFVGGDLTYLGLKGDGSSKYVDQIINGFLDLLQDDNGYTIYVTDDVNESKVDFGSSVTNFHQCNLRQGGIMYFYNAALSPTHYVSDSNPNSVGRYTSSRTGPNTHKAYKNGIQIGSTNTDASTSLPNCKIFGHARSDNNSATSPSSKCHGYLAIHKGLTDAEVLIHDGLIVTLMRDLGRMQNIAIGGSITQVGSDNVHTFASDDDLEFIQLGNGQTLRYLLVAGGGGGGHLHGGGGGGGGVLAGTGYSISLDTYPIVVGQGGAVDTSGTDTEFDGLVAVGGGKGGRYDVIPADNGGSGGGAPGSGTGLFGSGTPGQGFDGGNGLVSSFRTGGGGGGASEVGEDSPSNGVAGAGGDGVTDNITGSSVVYGGGGGGNTSKDTGGTPGAGGSGGGGIGGVSSVSAGANGTDGLGGGGGGGDIGQGFGGGTGGDGVAIFRYRARP